MSSRESPGGAALTSADPGVRRRRLAAVRRALRDRDRRSRPVPATRQLLGRAAAIEAISLTEPYTALIDGASGRLSPDRARRTADHAA